jgi:hypothetical protein
VTSAISDADAVARYNRQPYHQPSDEAAGIELGGAADDLVLTAALVRYFADAERWAGGHGKTAAAP